MSKYLTPIYELLGQADRRRGGFERAVSIQRDGWIVVVAKENAKALANAC
jgi:hypothetical protein